MLTALLSPEIRERLRKFRQMKRSYYSFLILACLFLFSVPSELIFNDIPLALKISGDSESCWYFPIFRDYTYRDFGGESDLKVQDYAGEQFLSLIEGIRRIPNPEVIFGDDDENLSDREIRDRRDAMLPVWGTPEKAQKLYTDLRVASARKIEKIYWPWVPYNYKTSANHPDLERQTYVAPFDWAGENESFRWMAGRYQHWLGTDAEGKDVLARIVYGFRISLIFGISLALTGACIGTLIGAIQGFFGGLVDLFGQRVTEIWAAIPQLFLLMILSKFMSDYFFKLSDFQHYFLLFGILNLTAWMGLAAYMRAEFLRARNLEYVRAAQSLGLSNFKIMIRHILPNSLTPIVTFLPFNISGGLLALVSLDFLGFGVKYPAPSLGELLQQGQEYLAAWWIILPTFLILATTLILLTFIGEGVRHAFDPREN